MIRTSLELPKHLIEGLDSLVDAQLYPHRSEAIRLAIKDLLELHGRLKEA